MLYVTLKGLWSLRFGLSSVFLDFPWVGYFSYSCRLGDPRYTSKALVEQDIFFFSAVLSARIQYHLKIALQTRSPNNTRGMGQHRILNHMRSLDSNIHCKRSKLETVYHYTVNCQAHCNNEERAFPF